VKGGPSKGRSFRQSLETVRGPADQPLTALRLHFGHSTSVWLKLKKQECLRYQMIWTDRALRFQWRLGNHFPTPVPMPGTGVAWRCRPDRLSALHVDDERAAAPSPASHVEGHASGSSPPGSAARIRVAGLDRGLYFHLKQRGARGPQPGGNDLHRRGFVSARSGNLVFLMLYIKARNM